MFCTVKVKKFLVYEVKNIDLGGILNYDCMQISHYQMERCTCKCQVNVDCLLFIVVLLYAM